MNSHEHHRTVYHTRADSRLTFPRSFIEPKVCPLYLTSLRLHLPIWTTRLHSHSTFHKVHPLAGICRTVHRSNWAQWSPSSFPASTEYREDATFSWTRCPLCGYHHFFLVSADILLQPFDAYILIKRLIVIKARWIPRARGCRLYIGPTLIGTLARRICVDTGCTLTNKHAWGPTVSPILFPSQRNMERMAPSAECVALPVSTATLPCPR